MSEISTTPWTDEEVAALIRRQNRSDLHAYNCGHGHGPLSVGREGWECLTCDYRQTWAHAVDVLAAPIPSPESKESPR